MPCIGESSTTSLLGSESVSVTVSGFDEVSGGVVVFGEEGVCVTLLSTEGLVGGCGFSGLDDSGGVTVLDGGVSGVLSDGTLSEGRMSSGDGALDSEGVTSLGEVLSEGRFSDGSSGVVSSAANMLEVANAKNSVVKKQNSIVFVKIFFMWDTPLNGLIF